MAMVIPLGTRAVASHPPSGCFTATVQGEVGIGIVWFCIVMVADCAPPEARRWTLESDINDALPLLGDLSRPPGDPLWEPASEYVAVYTGSDMEFLPKYANSAGKRQCEQHERSRLVEKNRTIVFCGKVCLTQSLLYFTLALWPTLLLFQGMAMDTSLLTEFSSGDPSKDLVVSAHTHTFCPICVC